MSHQNGPRSRSSRGVHLQEITTREPKENIETRYDTIAGVLNDMLEKGRLIRRRKGKRKVLWSLAEAGNQERMQSGEKALKTSSRLLTSSQESKPTGSGLFATGTEKSTKHHAKAPAGANRKAQSKDRLAGHCIGPPRDLVQVVADPR